MTMNFNKAAVEILIRRYGFELHQLSNPRFYSLTKGNKIIKKRIGSMEAILFCVSQYSGVSFERLTEEIEDIKVEPRSKVLDKVKSKSKPVEQPPELITIDMQVECPYCLYSGTIERGEKHKCLKCRRLFIIGQPVKRLWDDGRPPCPTCGCPHVVKAGLINNGAVQVYACKKCGAKNKTIIKQTSPLS